MVSTTTNLPPGSRLDAAAIDAWLAGVAPDRSKRELTKLRAACKLAFGAVGPEEGERMRQTLQVAEILAGMELDCDTLVAAILQGRCGGGECGPLNERFGATVARMVEGMDRIGALTPSSDNSGASDEGKHQENLRRMLLSLADDVRVILIVLAERLLLMRNLKHQPEAVQRREARETRDIYAPLANRLGIWQIKWELEDLSLRYLEPDTYKEIAGLLDGKRGDRERYIDGIIQLLQKNFTAAGIRAEISGRPKHIYSIWRKMRRKGVDIDQIFDLLAVRVLVDTVAGCYGALGVVHGLWKHIPGEFDDYIATPKANMYRSIHTAVIGPDEKPLEVQIRTREMHEHAELGVASHWSYKESARQDPEFERRVALMRSWLEMKDEEEATGGGEAVRSEFEAEQIYVLTPKGKVIELPKGATPLDFAYAIHSEVGHRCRGAKIDGRITQLTHPLESGQVVEIITAREGGPSRDWLSSHLGYLRTANARGKVRSWFKQQDYGEHLNTGRALLEREIARLGSAKPNLEQAAKRFNFKKPDDLLAAIGRGEVSPVQIAGMGERPESRKTEPPVRSPARGGGRRKSGKRSGAVLVEGVEELLTTMARCCKPVPYDPIIGFITRGHGVTVHRRDCPMLQKLDPGTQQRLVTVIWNDQPERGNTYPVDIRVLASDRKGLLRDISSIVTNEEVDLTAVNTRSDPRTDRATMRFTVEISDMTQLSRILDRIAQLPDVLEVRRQV